MSNFERIIRGNSEYIIRYMPNGDISITYFRSTNTFPRKVDYRKDIFISFKELRKPSEN